MAHFARIDKDNIVTTVLVVEKEVVDSGVLGNPKYWIQTSYNTRGGIYFTPNTNTPDDDQSKAFRKNYAGIGFKYDKELDAFIPPQPYPSWHLKVEDCQWYPPVTFPEDNVHQYEWDEKTISWKKIS